MNRFCEFYFIFRLFFALAFCVVFAISSYFISNVWMRWSEAPIIVTLNSEATRLADIPFPAVTICNMNKARRSIAKTYSHGSPDSLMLKTLCFGTDVPNTTHFNPKWRTFQNFLVDVSQSCDDMIISCSFGGLPYECNKIFYTILTDEGLCCNFNGVHPKFLVKNFK